MLCQKYEETEFLACQVNFMISTEYLMTVDINLQITTFDIWQRFIFFLWRRRGEHVMNTDMGFKTGYHFCRIERFLM